MNTQPLRIALMLPRFSRYGGVEQFGYRLAEALAARGYEVDFICARKETPAPEGVRVRTVGRPPLGKALKLAWFLWRAEMLRHRGGYDLSLSLGKTWNQDAIRMGGGPLRIFWEKSERALAPGWARTKKQIKRRTSIYNRLTLLIEKRQFTEKSIVIAVSHLVRDWLLQAHPRLLPENVHVVYNRPDTQRFSPPDAAQRQSARESLWNRLPEAARQALGTADAACFIGTASTNFELKGVDPLIKSLAKLPAHTALFVAGGRDSSAYATLAKSLGIADRVVFCGKVDDMPAFYKGLDIFILPTFYDACSNAVLEALASGCKTISTASNGASFFLEEDAVLADPGNVEKMASTLEDYMEKPSALPFAWPQDAPSGIEKFIEQLEDIVKKKRYSE